jgi:hypothetical protein
MIIKEGVVTITSDEVRVENFKFKPPYVGNLHPLGSCQKEALMWALKRLEEYDEV